MQRKRTFLAVATLTTLATLAAGPASELANQAAADVYAWVYLNAGDAVCAYGSDWRGPDDHDSLYLCATDGVTWHDQHPDPALEPRTGPHLTMWYSQCRPERPCEHIDFGGSLPEDAFSRGTLLEESRVVMSVGDCDVDLQFTAVSELTLDRYGRLFDSEELGPDQGWLSLSSGSSTAVTRRVLGVGSVCGHDVGMAEGAIPTLAGTIGRGADLNLWITARAPSEAEGQ